MPIHKLPTIMTQKIIVATTGPFALMDFSTGDEAHHARPSVVTKSQFINQRQGLGQLKVLSNVLRAEATDAEFVKYLKDSEDENLAIAAFVEKYEDKPEPKPEPQPEPKPEPKPAEDKKAPAKKEK